MKRDNYIKEQLKRHWDNLVEASKKDDFEIAALFLQGSQNYELDEYSDDYKSDIDTKAIVIPSLQNIVDGVSPMSKTLVLENDEHIDIKDIRVWNTMWEKQNISYLEVLFTKYFIINPKYEDIIVEIINKADDISRMNVTSALKCMGGMSKEKIHALKHPYPTVLKKIEKFGYDPKQLHHICRINEIVKRYISGESLKTAYIPFNKEYLVKLKKGLLSESDATLLAIDTDKETLDIVNKYCDENPVYVDLETKKFLYDKRRELIIRYLRDVFRREND